MRAILAGTAMGSAVFALSSVVGDGAAATAVPADQPAFAGQCAALTLRGARLTARRYHAGGERVALATQPGAPPASAALPAHCEVEGTLHERTGVDGQRYAIRFRLRLPQQWNGRFLFQGGGGTNGVVGDATGNTGGSGPGPLAQGFAVLAQDSGHDNATNSDPARGGDGAFAYDPQARADYGGASLRPVTLAARGLVRSLYGKDPAHSYFVGCSKGGQEGMVLAQREPDLYDGIVAAAPGFSLPRAALAEAWNVQAFAGAIRAAGQPVTIAALAAAIPPALGARVRTAVLEACDALDGQADGIVGDLARCTSTRVVPRLRAAQCKPGAQGNCLSGAQIDALLKVHDGVRDPAGRSIYPGFPWDAGWFDDGWRIWMTGLATVPALNVVLGGPSRATIFSTPPQPIGPTPDAMLAYQLAFSPARDAAAIDARGSGYARSAWEDIGARSSDLSRFRARGGRLIVPHGGSDPVFSLNDTIAWWQEVDRRNGGQAAGFARVFPVPGMGHCAGGPATDRYDVLTALTAWVEQGRAPDALPARAGPGSPWPGRERPLCRYPLVARGRGGAIRCS
ncbi:chlorogenate esterase [Sphingomonas metalli]|uniref:Chlorogenate esterase n=1 Tax=Sphingomonas metalli TaxID=1779358 RepID=A0A916WWY9_9SPHN|nr:tannase/feruloyl esterase family alpha/beta hydrolase [Sphingomonas metalli]GGB36267.1 chlorogenate esterase [Sphingomonas metalli]